MTDEPNDNTAPADDEEEQKDPLTRWIAVSLAAIALLGAGLGILQTNASVNESNTARETTRAAVGALRANVVEGAGQGLEQSIDAETASLLRQQAFVVRSAERNGDAAPPVDFSELSEATEDASGELPGARTQEELDRLAFETEQLTLTQETLAETRVTWNDRSTQYTTAIAILAVALFLTGFSLALKGLRRRVFYALGIAVALGSIGFAAYVYSLDVPETPEQAINTTARGVVESSNQRYERAVELYTEAIEIDGDFASPYTSRAVASVLGANPDFLATGAVTADVESFREAADDLLTARDLAENPDFLTLTLLSLLAFYAGQYDASVTAADDAIGINPVVPDVYLLRSAAEVGRGDAEAAERSLADGLELLSGADPSERTRALAANYITYLEYVVAAEPDQAELALGLEEQILALETGFTLGSEPSLTAPARGSVAVENLRYADGRLQLRLEWRNLPADTQLTAVAFERPTEGGPWVQPNEAALFRTVSGTGQEVVNAPLERACKPTEVRVDVYLNGVRVESATGPGVAQTC